MHIIEINRKIIQKLIRFFPLFEFKLNFRLHGYRWRFGIILFVARVDLADVIYAK